MFIEFFYINFCRLSIPLDASFISNGYHSLNASPMDHWPQSRQFPPHHQEFESLPSAVFSDEEPLEFSTTDSCFSGVSQLSSDHDETTPGMPIPKFADEPRVPANSSSCWEAAPHINSQPSHVLSRCKRKLRHLYSEFRSSVDDQGPRRQMPPGGAQVSGPATEAQAPEPTNAEVGM